MKEYIEPQIEIIEYRLVDVIASSQPQLNNNGSETGNEFEVDSNPVNPETSIPDFTDPIGDDWW